MNRAASTAEFRFQFLKCGRLTVVTGNAAQATGQHCKASRIQAAVFRHAGPCALEEAVHI